MMNRRRNLVPERGFHELQRDTESGYWIVRMTHNGRRLFKSTGERKSRAKAKKKARALIADFLGIHQEPELVRFKDVFTKVLEGKQGKAQRTIETFEKHTKLHLLPSEIELPTGQKKILGEMPVREVDEGIFQLHVIASRVKNPDRQLEHDWRFFREVMRNAFERRLVERKIRVENPDPEEAVGKEYTDDELARLLANASEDLLLQMEIAVTMGLRKSEILKMRWDWIHFEKEEIHIPARATKTKRFRVNEINKAYVLPKLKRRYIARRSEYVFHGFSKKREPLYDRPLGSNETAWSACKERAKVEGRFHDLRHTCASRLMRAGASMDEVGKLLGMSQEVLRRIYWHLNKTDRVRLADAVTLPPPGAVVCTRGKRKGKLLELQKA
jgi:integrase